MTVTRAPAGIPEAVRPPPYHRPMAPPAVAAEPTYNPAQQAVLDTIGARPGERPTFPTDLRDRLRADVEDRLANLAGELDPDRPLVVTKHDLAGVHGCQARFLAERRFEWSVPTARGTVAHKAIELSMHWRGEPTPGELVQDALSRLAERENGLADWLRTCSDVDRAELKSEATTRVTAFLEGWPPLRPDWRPVAESPVRAELFDGRLQLRGKVDLTVGRTVGQTAGKVMVDLKTGGFSPDHLHDLRFYALVETLRIGVPPRMVASYYLEAAKVAAEDVTETRLDAAVARTVAGVEALVALRAGRTDAVRRAGPPCWWCPVRTGCADGEAWVERAEDLG